MGPMMSLPLQQSPAFARALEYYGATVNSHAPVILQRRFGPLGRVDFASRVRLGDLAHRPRIINGEDDAPEAFRAAGYRQIITAAHIAEWDLTHTAYARRAAMHPKWRNQLRQAENRLKVRCSPWTGTPHPMFAKAEALARHRRFRPLPTPLIAAFAGAAPDNALIFEAFQDSQMVAAILVLRHGPTATYQTAWTSTEGRANHAHNLLLAHAADHLSQLGHTTFDLGLVDTDTAATLARFKLRTGARLRKLGGTWLRLF